MKNINNLLLATFLRKKVPYDSYIKQIRCKNSKEYPMKTGIFLPKKFDCRGSRRIFTIYIYCKLIPG